MRAIGAGVQRFLAAAVTLGLAGSSDQRAHRPPPFFLTGASNSQEHIDKDMFEPANTR